MVNLNKILSILSICLFKIKITTFTAKRLMLAYYTLNLGITILSLSFISGCIIDNFPTLRSFDYFLTFQIIGYCLVYII